MRDHALNLACLREGVNPYQARGYDDLSAETLARFQGTHIAAPETPALRAALATGVRELTREGALARLGNTEAVAASLATLSAP